MNSDEHLTESQRHFDLHGWCILPKVISEPEVIASDIKAETVRCYLSDGFKEENKLGSDDDILSLLTDSDLREKHLVNPKSIWYNRNTRTPKVAKSTGLVNIFHNPLVREQILFNPNIYREICDLYGERAVYLYGPDRVGVKPSGATDMPRHIDCDLLSTKFVLAAGEEPLSASTHPFQLRRIQAVACLACDENARANGGTKVLAGYHHYFALGSLFFADKLKVSPPGAGRAFAPIQVQKLFSDHLEEFRDYVASYYKEDKLRSYTRSPIRELRSLSREERVFIHSSLPESFVPFGWEKPKVSPGDVFCFDQRLPHRNTKNSSGVTRVVAYVSLYPTTQHRGEDITALFKGTAAPEVRSCYHNREERETFADDWEARVEYRKSVTARRATGLRRLKVKSAVAS
jgi:hypothetical protein